jgi:hypothetical protein
MKAFTGTRAEIERLATEADKVLGYPKPGVNVGGGVHAPSEMTATTKHVEPKQNRKTGDWTLPVDGDAEVVCDGLKAASVVVVTKTVLDDPTDLWSKIGGG